MFGGSRISRLALVLGLLSGLVGPLLGSDLPTVQEIQRGYEMANGGLRNLQNLTSVAASGISRFPNSQEMTTKLYIKRPGLLRIHVDSEAGRLTIVLNEEGAFKSFENQLGEVRTVELAGEELVQLQMEAVIGGPLYQLRDKIDYMSVEGALMMDGVLVYEIMVDPDLDSPYERLWVHRRDFYVVKLLSRIPKSDGGVIEEVTHFSNHEQVNGVWMAKEIEYIHDGEPVQWMLFDSITGNVGLFDSFFKKPR